MIKENKQIKEFVTEYRDFLAANHINVAHSLIKDEWFVYQKQKEFGYYEYFIPFSTVNELVDIVLDEMKFALYSAIGNAETPPEYDNDNIIQHLDDEYCEKSTAELAPLLEMILADEQGKASVFFQSLDKLFKKSEEKY